MSAIELRQEAKAKGGGQLKPTQEHRHRWRYLGRKPSSGYRQLFVKSTRVRAASVVYTMQANGYTAKQVAEDMGIPIGAVKEAILYTELRFKLIQSEEANSIEDLQKTNLLKPR